jgi:hypothetical protein
VDPIFPKLEPLKLSEFEIATTPLPPKFGELKFGWFKMLKNSVRNCIENRSLIWMPLNNEKSRRWNPGPVVVAGAAPRTALPVSGMQPGGESGIGPLNPSWQGCWKAFGFPN